MFQKLLRQFSPVTPQKISDAEWLSLQLDPKRAREKYSIPLPDMPDDATQLGFTAQSGKHNMKQAFEFYNYVRNACDLDKNTDPKVLDFGGGWGRVARLFLRDTKSENIYLAETRASVIKLLKDANAPYSAIHNQPLPPIDGLPDGLDLVFAYSVFSHLSEEYFLAWTQYFLEKLRPGGHIVFTSRGDFFIKHLQVLHDRKEASRPELAEHIRRLKEMMPAPDEIARRFEQGEFQFYPIGGSGELTPNFFGEAFIPEAYLKQHFPAEFVSFVETIPTVDQSITVLRKR